MKVWRKMMLWTMRALLFSILVIQADVAANCLPRACVLLFVGFNFFFFFLKAAL